ncbi:MAG TPA: hypothetical protein VJH90_02100 [archaeon]|nr:hypothetical protein [archaeon]
MPLDMREDRIVEMDGCGCHKRESGKEGYCSSHEFQEYISSARNSGRTVIESSE